MPKVTKDREAMLRRGNILLELRKSRNVNQSAIADYLGISQQAYLKYEHGDADPTIDTLIKLTEFYNVSTDYLLGKETEQPEQNPIDMLQTTELITDSGTKISEKGMLKKYFSMPPKTRAAWLEIALDILEHGINFADDEYPDFERLKGAIQSEQPSEIQKSRKRQQATLGELEDAQITEEQAKKTAG